MAARKTAATKPPAESAGWDAFWAEVQAKGATEVIRGVTVPVPSDLPLSFQMRMNALKDSDRDEDIRELVGLIFGVGVLDQWVDAGMGAQELKIVLAWGVANGGGKPVTFREAYDLVMEAEAAGKAPSPQPNRATRRAASTGRSSASGGALKPTSRANTASARRTSRA